MSQSAKIAHQLMQKYNDKDISEYHYLNNVVIILTYCFFNVGISQIQK